MHYLQVTQNVTRTRLSESLHCNGHSLVSLLQDCAKSKDLVRGSGLHSQIVKSDVLERDPFVGNALVDMYAKCGSITKAQAAFEDLVLQDVVSWNSLIGGYANLERGEDALSCLERMQIEGTFPDAFTYVCSLKACGSFGAMSKGKEIHAKVLTKGLLDDNVFVGNALIDMYAKHGLLMEAQRVLYEIPIRDTVSWNALIAGYVKHRVFDRALSCYEKLQCEGILPTAITFVCALKACVAIGAAKKGREIHAQIVLERLLRKNYAVGLALIDMYVKCGPLTNAKDVFSKLAARDATAYATLFAGYVEHELAEQILECAEQMRLEGIFGNSVTFVYQIKACGMIGSTKKGAHLHIEISESGFLEKDCSVGNALVDMYAKCGSLLLAHSVLRKLSGRNVVSWTALIAGYTNCCRSEEALNCFEQMQYDGVSPNAISFVCGLRACGLIKATEKGLQLHAEIARMGLLDGVIAVGNALVDMYVKFGCLVKAHEVFDSLPVHDVVSWTEMIAGYVSHECGEQALNCFEEMKLEGVLPNSLTIVCNLQACVILGALDKGRSVHAEIVGKGFVERDLVVGNALISMYAKLSSFSKAREVLDSLSVRDVVSWTALIAGYVHHEHGAEAMMCLERMQMEGVCPNAVTFLCILKACGSIRTTEKGTEIHEEVSKLGISGQGHAVGNALVGMYASCGSFEKAREVFDQLSIRDSASWNALISGYLKHDRASEALKHFEWMQFSGLSPDPVSFVCCLKACGSVGAIRKGCEVHAEIARIGLLEGNPVVGNALVNMYSKCGLTGQAMEVFDKLLVRDTVSWTSLIAGHAQLGMNQRVVTVLDGMKREGSKPDLITFTNVLKTCTQACLWEKGKEFYEAISKDCGMSPTVEHHTCIVDLLGQAGQLEKAVSLVENMPCDLDIGVWHTLLDACQNLGSLGVGQRAFKSAVQLDDKSGAAYVRMNNMYVDARMRHNTKEVEALGLMVGACSRRGPCCWDAGESCVSSLVDKELIEDFENNDIICKKQESAKGLLILEQLECTKFRSSHAHVGGNSAHTYIQDVNTA